MSYWIMIFNQKPLGAFTTESLLTTIRSAHLDSLCEQYGLDSALIQPALAHLRLETSPGQQVPFFMLRYQPQQQPPVVINWWSSEAAVGKQILSDILTNRCPSAVREHLSKTRVIYGVGLANSQLRDLGLVLGYEFARWGAHQGSGMVLGLDGSWYRLNQHQAFIPLPADEKYP